MLFVPCGRFPLSKRGKGWMARRELGEWVGRGFSKMRIPRGRIFGFGSSAESLFSRGQEASPEGPEGLARRPGCKRLIQEMRSLQAKTGWDSGLAFGSTPAPSPQPMRPHCRAPGESLSLRHLWARPRNPPDERMVPLDERMVPLDERMVSLDERMVSLDERMVLLAERRAPLAERRVPLDEQRVPFVLRQAHSALRQTHSARTQNPCAKSEKPTGGRRGELNDEPRTSAAT